MPRTARVHALRRTGTALAMGTALLGATLLPGSPAMAEIATGPEVGEKIPALDARDQHGKMRSFDDLKGPEGLLVLFYRTADW